jgi:hypothetical protein
MIFSVLDWEAINIPDGNVRKCTKGMEKVRGKTQGAQRKTKSMSPICSAAA